MLEIAVLTAIEDVLFTTEAVEAVLLSMRRNVGEMVARSLMKALVEVEKRIVRLADAIAARGEMTSLVARVRSLKRGRWRGSRNSAPSVPSRYHLGR